MTPVPWTTFVPKPVITFLPSIVILSKVLLANGVTAVLTKLAVASLVPSFIDVANTGVIVTLPP